VLGIQPPKLILGKCFVFESYPSKNPSTALGANSECLPESTYQHLIAQRGYEMLESWSQVVKARTLHLIVPLEWVLNFGTMTQVIKRELERRNQSHIKATQETRWFYPVVWPSITLAYFHVVASQWTRVALNPFQVIQWSTWIPQFLSYSSFPVCEESPQVGASHPYKVDHNTKHKSKEGKETHTQD
jgi:hypothetical protein